jgi:hypothetical protein
MAAHPRDLKPNDAGLVTGDLPAGALYCNSDDAELEPPLKVLEKHDDGAILVDEVDVVSGEPIGCELLLERDPGGHDWSTYVPPLIALPQDGGAIGEPEATDAGPERDATSAAARPTSRGWRKVAHDLLYRTRWQVVTAVAVGITVTLVSAVVEGDPAYSPFDARDDYHAFALGLSSILALVASITFGFLLYHLQSVTAEKHMLYARFKESVAELRRFLGDRHDAGLIDRSYDYPFGVVQELTLEDFPVMSFGDVIAPTVDAVTDQREQIGEEEFGPLLRGLAYRVNDIEEAVAGLFMVFVKEIGTVRMLAPVTKAFEVLAVIILAVLVAAISYGEAVQVVLYAAVIAFGVMAALLVNELALVARREAGELKGMSLLEQ